MKKSKVIAVVGATASGKTSYAIELAKKIDGEIVSADSRLVYKGLDIGTAKPTLEERSNVPHYMIDIVEPEVDYSAGLYAKEAKKCIDDILMRGKVPVVVGGTGLYFRILLENFNLPETEPDYDLRKQLRELDFPTVYKMLYELDPDAASLVNENDKRRAIRFIEVIRQCGCPLSKARGFKEAEYDVDWIGLNFSREELYERINKRVDLMIEQGLVDETKHLLAKHGRIPTIVDTIGYREIILYLDGIMGLEEAVDKLKQNTRNYAKRQLTWFRKNPDIKWNCYPERKRK